MRVVILQSNYLPWKGYFDLIARADRFVFYDQVQYTHQDWRNRNRLKWPDGQLRWLTVPVGRSHGRRIDEVTFSKPDWRETHVRTIIEAYGKAPHFDPALLDEVFFATKSERLSEFNQHAIGVLCGRLGIVTPLLDSKEFAATGDKTQRLADILKAVGATHYVTGPSAIAYLHEDLLAVNGIEVEYMDYSGYPTYPQGAGPFEHAVSVLDLLFWTGPEARNYLKF